MGSGLDSFYHRTPSFHGRYAVPVLNFELTVAVDQVFLLRTSYAPLVILELATKAVENALCLPCDTFIDASNALPDNAYVPVVPIFSFLTHSIVQAIRSSTVRILKNLKLNPKELVLLKALVVFNCGLFFGQRFCCCRRNLYIMPAGTLSIRPPAELPRDDWRSRDTNSHRKNPASCVAS